jgi:HAT1-interacting factor 1
MADDAPTTAVEAAAADTTTNAEPSLTSTTGTTSILSDITKTIEHLAPATAPSTNPGTPSHLTGAPTTGTATPFEMDPEQRRNSLNVSLADLSAKANALYAHKSYEEAAEVFAAAAEMQAEMNGEMNPANAEILFMYGRALFKVGQGKSDVLGGKAPEAKTEQKKPKKKAKKVKAEEGDDADKDPNVENEGKVEAAKAAEQEERVAEEAVKIIADSTSGAKKVDEKLEAKKPLFQFTGDENFEESDEEEVRLYKPHLNYVAVC